MTRCLITRSCGINGQAYEVGQSVEVDDLTRDALLGMDAAVTEAEPTDAADDLADLDVLFPAPNAVQVGDEVIEVRPLTVGQLPAILKAGEPLLTTLSCGEADLASLMVDHSEAVLDCIAIALARDRGWVDGLALDQALALAGLIIESNADFFVRRAAPALSRTMERISTMRVGVPSSSN